MRGMNIHPALGVGIAVALAISACAPADAPVLVTGTVSGTVTMEGEAPKAEPLSISVAGSQGCCEPGTRVDDTDRSLLIDEDGGIANVVITLTVEGAEVVLPSESVVVELNGCRIEPHQTVVHVGTSVSWKNSDAISHNIHTYVRKNEAVGRTVGGSFGELVLTLTSAEAFRVGCDIHPWMESYVYVTEATHFTITGIDGSFKIEGVPPGEYKLDIWHGKLGKSTANVTVRADGSSDSVAVKMVAGMNSARRRR